MLCRPTLLPVCAVAAAVSFAAYVYQWDRGASDLRAARAVAGDLAERELAVRHQYAESNAVVRRLLAGELTLCDAVRDLESINHSRVDELRAAYTGAFLDRAPSDREVLAYLALVKVRRAAGAEDRGEVLSRLEEEYRELFGAVPPGDDRAAVPPCPPIASVRD